MCSPVAALEVCNTHLFAASKRADFVPVAAGLALAAARILLDAALTISSTLQQTNSVSAWLGSS